MTDDTDGSSRLSAKWSGDISPQAGSSLVDVEIVLSDTTVFTSEAAAFIAALAEAPEGSTEPGPSLVLLPFAGGAVARLSFEQLKQIAAFQSVLAIRSAQQVTLEMDGSNDRND